MSRCGQITCQASKSRADFEHCVIRLNFSCIDDFFQRFKDLVRTRRPEMSPEQLSQATTGRVFSAGQALELGLIDGLAYPEEAFEAAKELASLREARLVLYHRPKAHRPNISATGAADPGPARAGLLDLAAGPHFMYIWLPGIQ